MADRAAELTPALEATIRARSMIRSFEETPLPREEVDHVLDLARRAPAAGNTSAVDYLVLDTPSDVDRYWSTTLTSAKRERFRWQSLLVAPVLIVLTTRPDAYVERYAEPDKARGRLGADAANWAQPFWWIDAGMVAQNLLLQATARGWGASLFGLFDHEPAVAEAFGVPSDRRLVCSIALGLPSSDDEPGRSAGRGRPPIAEIVHRGGWDQSAV